MYMDNDEEKIEGVFSSQSCTRSCLPDTKKYSCCWKTVVCSDKCAVCRRNRARTLQFIFVCMYIVIVVWLLIILS